MKEKFLKTKKQCHASKQMNKQYSLINERKTLDNKKAILINKWVG